jgi:plasmid maintenance system antidote protein VapI
LEYGRDSMNFRTAELIREEYQNSNIRQYELAKKYNTSQRAVSMIVNNKSFNAKEVRPDTRMLYQMKLQKVILWVKPEDLAAVKAYDLTRVEPSKRRSYD